MRLNHVGHNLQHPSSPFGRRHFPRDSGCYEGSPVPTQTNNQLLPTDDAHSLDDVVAQCSNEILKRVENARRMKEEKFQTKAMSRVAKKGLLGGAGDDTLSRGGALSEKSSDSGVSSSSLSSAPHKHNT